jgi:hypothetical protein
METGEDDGKSGLLNRRTYLKAAGVTALAGLTTGTVAGESTLKNALVIETSETATYEFSVGSDVQAVQTMATVRETVENGTVSGEVTDGVAAYRIAGGLESINVDGAAAVNYGADDGLTPEPANELVITSPSEVNYEFTTTGEVRKVLDNGRLSAEANDDVLKNEDGTYTASGYTGNGYGDTYRFRGEVTAFSPKDGEFSLELNGEPVSAYDLTGTKRNDRQLVITSPSEVNYEFSVTGGAEKVTTNGDKSAETNDDVVENDDGSWTVSGYTGNGYGDTYRFRGDVTDFSPMRGDYSLMLDGEPVSAYDLTGEEPPSQSSAVIGGGEGYKNTVDPSEADVTVGTAEELEGALDSASAGDVVYVDGDATIELGGRKLTLPRGITLASNRGIDGAPGGQIRTDKHPWPMLTVRDDVRVTGVRISGAYYSYVQYTDGKIGIGLDVRGEGVEIDNAEIFGFSYAAVRARNDTHVHHSHIHHNPMGGLGYGVSCENGHPVIEYNYMNYNRHSVASSGDGGYTCAYNHFGPKTIGHVIDVHRPGGTTIDIHHNTVEADTKVQNSETVPAVAVRGVPDDAATIQKNWFYNDNQPKATPDGWDDSAITQVHTSDWNNVQFSDNYYGSDEPAGDLGHPR